MAGGAATGGGINFQAAVTAIAFAYTLRGQRLGWLDGLQDDVPVSVAAETGGGGDDIRLQLRSGKICDIQAKRGLRRGSDLWDALLTMCAAVAEGKIDFAVLAVSSSSSGSVREDLANAIPRIGDGRIDNLPAIAELFLAKLAAAGWAAEPLCRALRIVTVSAATHDAASTAAARAELGHLCRDASKIGDIWNILYRDAIELIDRRGRREPSSLVQLLKANGINLSDNTASPATLLFHLAEWTINTNATFSILGVKKPLRLSRAWIPLQAMVREEQAPQTDLMAALAAYQSWHNREYPREAVTVNPETLGRFIKLGVLVAGPGMGKTTLLSRIAHAYAKDGIPVLRVRLASVAARMRAGETFEESILALGLAGSTISPSAAKSAGIRNWVVLCDGLDETGAAQSEIASAAERFATGHPECRIIVTTRPIGYHASDFAAWRHYDIVPLDRYSAHDDLARLLEEIGGQDSELQRKADKIAKIELEEDAIATAVVRSPLLMALGASVIARGGSIATSRNRLYDQLFTLVDEAPNTRIPVPPAEPAILRRFLDILGWQIVAHPIASIDVVICKCAEIIADELGMRMLVALGAAQSYLRYWQDVGLVERIGLQGAEAVTFLHKTFGEFAAARFLVAMPAAQRNVTLASIRDDSSWSETLDFAARSGIGEEVCTVLMDGIAFDASGVARAVRSLEICGEAEPAPSEQVRAKFLKYAVAMMRSPRRRWVAEIGIAMLPFARRFPDEIAPHCVALVSHPQSWTRLAAWASLTAAGPSDLDYDRLLTVICEEPLLTAPGMWSGHGGGLVIDRSNERELAQVFVLTGARRLLEHFPGQATDVAVAAACRIEGLSSISFVQRASRLLKEFGKPDDLWSRGSRSALDLLSPAEGFLDAQRKAHAALFDAIDVSGAIIATTSPPPEKLLNLSAFLSATGYMKLPISDIWCWQEPFDRESVRETIRAAVEASGLPEDILEHEVRIARGSLHEDDTLMGMFKFITDVDVPPIDWKAAIACKPDLVKIEAALYHRSQWVIWIAAHLIESLSGKTDLESITRRAIAGGRGDTLWAAASLATELNQEEMTTAIYNRLNKETTRGCEHLLFALPELKAPVDARLLAAFRQAFLRGTTETAMAAGKIAAEYASSATPELLPVLEEAAAYWKVHEEPYPTKGGVIPDSPRAKIAEASAAIQTPTYETLKIYATDSRSDVRELGTKTMVVRLGEEPQLAATFLADIELGELPPTILDKVLTNGVSWDTDRFIHVKEFLNSPQDNLRYAAMSILQQNCCAEDFIREVATRMTNDPDRQIKERAYRILDTLEQ